MGQASLTAHGKKMLGLDEWWEIDATFLHWLLGEDSAAGVKEAWASRCIPLVNVVNVDDALANSKQLMDTHSRFTCHDQMLANLKARCGSA